VSSSLEIHFYCTYNGLSHCCCSTKNPVRMPWQIFESDTLRHADKVTTFVFSQMPCLAVSSFFLPFLFLTHSFFCIHEENITAEGKTVHVDFIHISVPKPVAELIDPWLGHKVNSGIGSSYRPASPCIAWRGGTTTLCRSWLYLPSQDLWIRLLL
jgi:hypothetical protein